jgi:hypothetical protein
VSRGRPRLGFVLTVDTNVFVGAGERKMLKNVEEVVL